MQLCCVEPGAFFFLIRSFPPHLPFSCLLSISQSLAPAVHTTLPGLKKRSCLCWISREVECTTPFHTQLSFAHLPSGFLRLWQATAGTHEAPSCFAGLETAGGTILPEHLQV